MQQASFTNFEGCSAPARTPGRVRMADIGKHEMVGGVGQEMNHILEDLDELEAHLIAVKADHITDAHDGQQPDWEVSP